MVAARASARAAMLTGAGVTALALVGEAPLPVRARAAMLTGAGVTALTLTGEAPMPFRARAPGRAAGTAGEAGQAPEAARADAAADGRDPFVRPAPPSPGGAEVRPAGLSGLAVDEAVLRGVVSIRGGRLAVLDGPDARAWVARPGDRLYDGRVQGITADGVVLLRDAAGSAALASRVVRLELRDRENAR